MAAGDTFSGALANVKAALSRLGEGPGKLALESLRKTFNAAIPAVDALSSQLTPFVEQLNGKLTPYVDRAVKLIEQFSQGLQDGSITVQDIVGSLGQLAGAFALFAGVGGNVDKLTNANDSEVAQVEDESVDITKVLVPVAQLAPPVEFWRWMDLVAQDDEQAWGQSGPATGQSSDKGKTAYANQIEQFWTESEIGYHGQALTAAVKRLARLRLRAVVHAMQSVGDAAGGTATQGPDVELAPIGVTDGDGQDGTAAEAVVADDKGAQGPAVAEAEAPAVAAETGEGDPTRVGAIVVAEFTVKDNDGNEHRVTVEALDADFVIKFVDGARTPMADAALLQFLSTQGQTYMGWFDVVMAGGPKVIG